MLRDKAWRETDRIPSWVRGREVSLDQYNTMDKVAEYCWKSFKNFLKQDGATLSNYKIIEPSAGTGSFYKLLPKSNRIGIDVGKFSDEYIQQDFLTWEPNHTDQRPCIAIGNPPFGYRGWLALEFLNKAAEFCDYVGFILPMSFQSDGKGSPKHRVKGMTLVHSEHLSGEIFVKPNGEKIKVNTLWQIWKKGEASPLPDLSMADEYLDIFTVDYRKERLCGMDKVGACNVFLQRSYFKDPPKIVSDFADVKYVCGYGIIIKKDEVKVRSVLENIDWSAYNNLATHSVKHISMYHIKKAFLDNFPEKMTIPNYKNIFLEAIKNNADNPKWNAGDFIGIKTVSNTKVGNIGLDFVEGLCKDLGIPCDFPHRKDKQTRATQSPWDIEINGVKFELKTATEDVGGSFQFNHIRYHRQYEAVLCLGVTPNDLWFGVWSKADVVTGKAGNLVSMEKGANASYKLTKKPQQLMHITEFEKIMSKFIEDFKNTR